MKKDVQEIPIDAIRRDGGTQARVSISGSVVSDYTAALDDGATFPPLIVFHDGKDYWLGDGFHRFLAYQRAEHEYTHVPCEVRPGTSRDALLYAVGANAEHGLQRTSEDKANAIGVLLADPEWSKQSIEWIAKTARVSWSFARRTVDATNSRAGVEEPATREGVNGREYGRRSWGPEPKEELPSPSGGKDAPAPLPPSHGLDSLGIDIPADRGEAFAARQRFDEALAIGRQLARLVNQIASGPGGDCYRLEVKCLSVHKSDDPEAVRFVCTDLRNAMKRLEESRPYCCVCPYCCPDGGEANPECEGCDGRGWMTEEGIRRTPEDLKTKLNRKGEAA